MYRNFFSTNDEFDRMRSEMDKIFRLVSSPSLHAPAGYPAVNTWADKDKIIVNAELPGVQETDIDISIEGDTLTISGERKPLDLQEGAVYHRQERGSGKFTRVLKMPYQVDPEKVDALLKNGVLEVKLERSEADKPRLISVKKG
ncbi:MAG: Hsp20/alpha crystallin family protein [Anaerolineaceae bacterium]|nr:Hsp20/alpha crystallin family protein [Anaerolineaceae bacterium]